MAKSLNPLLQIGRWLCLAPLVLAACTGSGGPGTTGSKADATAISVDAGLSERAPDALVADAVRAADTGPPATPDAAGNRDLPQPDAGAGDGTGQVFVPPMPSVGTDSTLMDMTDFGTSQGFKIILDYRYDTTQSMTRDKRLVLRTAAASWEQFIASDFAPVPAGTYISARDLENMDAGGSNFTVTYPIDDLVIFLGMASIYNASGDTLGEATSSKTTLGMTADLAAVLNGRYNGNPFQPWVATVAFDKDNALFVDATMDTSDDIPSDQNDFYSVAMHEFGHVLGMGSSLAYQALVVDATFTGAHAVAVYGAPVPLASDSIHVLNTVIVDGRQVVMARYDVAGTRSLITRLDLAMLEDLGYIIRR
jgi:hypothetical protein